MSQNIDLLDPFDAEDDYIASCVRRFGGAASISLFDSYSESFKLPHIDGVIGYQVKWGCAVILGEPICDPKDRNELADAFHEHCKKNGWHFVYITVSESFAKSMVGCKIGSAVEIGEELILNPQENFTEGAKGRSLRNKIHVAEKAGLQVYEYKGADPLIEKALDEVASTWLGARKGPQIYIAQVDLFKERLGRRWFYVKDSDKIVGTLLLNQMEARGGELVQISMVIPDAPIGSSEYLIDQVIETLKKEGCSLLSFGVAQHKELGEIIGFGRVKGWIMRKIFKIMQSIFRLDKKRSYWEKFQPKGEKSYLLFSQGKIGLKEMVSLMHAFHISF